MCSVESPPWLRPDERATAPNRRAHNPASKHDAAHPSRLQPAAPPRRRRPPGREPEDQDAGARGTRARRDPTRAAPPVRPRPVQAAERKAEAGVEQVEELAERVFLTGLGAVVVTGDRVTEAAEYLRKTYGLDRRRPAPPASVRAPRDDRAQQARARDQATRTRLERNIKRNRTQVERQVKPLTDQVDVVTARVENVVRRRHHRGRAGRKSAASERVACVASATRSSSPPR